MRRYTVSFFLVVALLVAACADDASVERTTQSTSVPATSPSTPATTGTSPVVSEPGDEELFDRMVPDGEKASVVRVLDGDSLVVALNGQEHEVRLVGINAPERTECHGEEARDALAGIVDGGEVVLARDRGDDRDRFDRLLRVVFVRPNPLSVNASLIEDGHAIALAGDYINERSNRESMRVAIRQGRGMFAPEACGTAGDAQIEISELQHNPPGPDGDDLNGEYVVLTNTGPAEVGLSGWTLRDESTSNRYVVPDGVAVASGAAVRISVGCGTDTVSELYWCAEAPVWNNGGDTALLLDANGSVVAARQYEGN